MLESLTDNQKGKVKSIISRLLAVNFLNKDKEQDIYYEITAQKKIFEQIFDLLGFELKIAETKRCIYLMPQEPKLRHKFNKEETKWLLVIRLLYHEKLSNISLTGYPLVQFQEIRQKYEAYGLNIPSKGKLEEIFKLFQRYNLIEYNEDVWHNEESMIKLYDGWVFFMDNFTLDEIAAKIKNYTEKGEEANEIYNQNQIN